MLQRLRPADFHVALLEKEVTLISSGRDLMGLQVDPTCSLRVVV